MAQPSTTAVESERSALAAPLSYGVGLAMISYAASSLLTIPAVFWPYGLAAALVIAVLGSVLSIQLDRRRRPVRDLTQALGPVLGPEKITARGWANGIPTRVKIVYSAAFKDRDEKARAEVRTIVATRLGAPVSATWRTNKRTLLCDIDASALTGDIIESDTVAAGAHPDDSTEQGRLRTRTTDVVRAIMGPMAGVADIDFNGDTPTRVEVTYPTTSRDLSANYRHRVVMMLDAKLPGNWRDSWDFENDKVTFELRPPFPENVRYPITHKLKAYELPYAVTEQNQIVSWKLGSKNPHCLVVGPTGSGKTVYIRNLVVACRVLGVPVVLCDPKMTEYMDFEGLDGVTVLTEAEDIAEAIERTHDEMMSRYRRIKRRQNKKGDFSRILFVLDEFYIFKEAIQEIWAAMKAANKDLKGREHPCLSMWRRLTVLARTAMIHLVLGIQRPDAEFLTGLARDSFRHRVSLDRATPETARMMWGDAHTGTDLPSIQGRAVATTEHGAEYVQVLRLLTPEDGDGFDVQDAEIWNNLITRMTHQAEAHANGDDPLGFLGHLNQIASYIPREQLGATHAPVPIEQAIEEAEAAAAADELAGGADSEEVGVYELEVGDRVTLMFDRGEELVTVEDLHYGEDTDDADDEVGDEWIEIDYTGEDGSSGSMRLTVDALLQRKITSRV
ncbi:FtsK/SpoIIIE domain-containing protein [Streptomyces justiciae]|uniref:FtsK/SpoIIIE domain-containing protein n=1 Tax=Streptomyces justiciae TaxID=2780140 RepID=UPI002118582E|nr:FtsK/SpoIIIE domain-containing protein [Streptomyces justiciae]MCW8383925.1 FtsK/SpoIIIE domain-containing protein [Streptomyces justiciae]